MTPRSQSDSPLFSVVTISYNQAAFLPQAIESVVSQDFRDYEYHVFDGGSTDGSVDIIKENESSIESWQSRKDGGPAAALNEAIDRCRGRYLIYINSDDWLLPGALARMSRSVQEFASADVVYGHGYRFYQRTRRYAPVFSDRWGTRAYARGLVSVFQQSTAIKLDAVRSVSGFNSMNRTCWDGELLFDIGMAGGTFCRINEFFAVFRLHDSSITGSQVLAQACRDDQRRFANAVGISRPLQKGPLCSGVKFFRDPWTMMRKGAIRFGLGARGLISNELRHRS